jgi:protein-S-isoprenylcysteine O-methyltransferase Ste14
MSAAHAVAAIALAGVLVRFMIGATAAFRPAPGEPPSPLTIVMTIAALVLALHVGRTPIGLWQTAAGVAGLAASLALYEWAKHTIRGRFFSYIFSSDVPDFVCTAGPYAYIRNPFYLSYLVAYASAVAMTPDVVTGGVLVVMTIYFWSAARFEERKFTVSERADEYEAYRRRTGRFVPRLW